MRRRKSSGKRRRRRNRLGSQWAQMSKSIRAQRGACEICGSDKRLQVHHLLPRRSHPALVFEEKNLICLCGRHHWLVHHGHEWELVAWLKTNKPEQYAYVMELAQLGWS